MFHKDSSYNFQETARSLSQYLPPFLFPVILSVLLLFFYQTGLGSTIPYSFYLSGILLRGIAGICCFAYFQNTKSPVISEPAWRLLLSCAYALCSYGLVQESTVGTLIVYAVFPLLFLFLEKLICDGSCLWFILLLSAMLFADPGTALPALLLLCLLFFGITYVQKQLTASNICRFFGCILITVLITGIRLFPYLVSCYDSDPVYSGFTVAYTPALFISRFLLGSIPSISFVGTNGMDLFFGTLFLLIMFLFFTLKQIPPQKRVCYFIITVILLLSVELSPCRYLLSLFTSQDETTISYCFVLIFWGLYLASEALPYLKEASFSNLTGSMFLTVLTVVLAWLGCYDNFHPIARNTLILFLILYFAAMLGFRYLKGFQKSVNVLLICLVTLELFCNAFITTNLNFVPSERSLSTRYPWNVSAQLADMTDTEVITVPTAISDEDYKKFLSEYQYTETYSLVTQLLQNISLEENEYEIYGGKKLLNIFEMINACCRKIGCSEDLFLPADDISVSFSPSDLYDITEIDSGLYNVYQRSAVSGTDQYYLPFTVSSTSPHEGRLFLFCDYTDAFLCLDESLLSGDTIGYLCFYSQPNFCVNYRIDIYELNEELAKILPTVLTSYLTEHSQSTIRFSDYAGIVATCLGILLLLLLFFNKDKKVLYRKLSQIPEGLSCSRPLTKIRTHLSQNHIYYYAFLIPVVLFITSMIIFDCVPFGNNSFYDGDGLSLTLPSNLDYYYSLQDGNKYLSLNAGYGYNMYATTPTIGLLSFYRLFSAEQIAPLMLLGEALCLGLCGFAMVFYLTHRINAAQASKNDVRLLIPALAYSLNAYMLAMHSFTAWYYVFFAVPLLFLAMDYLMYRKKTLAYVLILSCCIILNLYLSLYICIFLVIYFFTCHFDCIKDFFKKGCRFAFCSILAAGNGFFVIANTLLSSSDSAYQNADSQFPSPGFHTSFWEQWKQHMIFSENVTITADNGYVNIYCGVITLLLVAIFFMSKKISLSEKLRKLIPILILYLSFNEQILSFIWNGFHYQSKVPNRYAFLLLLELAVLAYDGICLLETISIRSFCATITAVAAFLGICYFLSDSTSKLPLIATLILCVIYICLYVFYKQKGLKPSYYRILTCLLTAELFINMLYTTSGYALTSFYLIRNYDDVTDYVASLKEENGFFRTSFPSSHLSNAGMIYNIPSNSIFNSYVNRHQIYSGFWYGFFIGTNLTISNYNSTPFGLSLCGTRYSFITTLNNTPISDLSEYEYLGKICDYYVYENPDTLSLGIYAPESVLSLNPNDNLIDAYNSFVSAYTGSDTPLFSITEISYSEDTSSENSFYFTDSNGNKLSLDETSELYDELRPDADAGPISSIRMHIDYTPKSSSQCYLFSSEFVSLGKGEKDKTLSKELPYPNVISSISDTYYVLTMDDTVYRAFITEAQKNQLENVTIQADTITATTDYEEDGYTMLSLAWDKGWHAYLDGEEVEVEDPYNSIIMIKTPAGKHTLTLSYVPYGMKTSKLISLGFMILTVLIHGSLYLYKKKKSKTTTEKSVSLSQ